MSAETVCVSVDPPVTCRHRCSSKAVGRLDALAIVAEQIDRRPLFYLEHPETGTAIVAAGSAHDIRSEGPMRFAEAARAARAVFAGLSASGETDAGMLPRLVGGFGFAPGPSTLPAWREFAPCWLFLPEDLWVGQDGDFVYVATDRCAHGHVPNRDEGGAPFFDDPLDRETGHRGCSSVEGADEGETESSGQCSDDGGTVMAGGSHAGVPMDERTAWNERVRRVLAEIESGHVSKLVLSRRASGRLCADGNLVRILRRFRRQRPGCYTFLVASGETCFVGSTPELLVRHRGECVESHSLAGTVARVGGSCDEAALSASLLASTKDAREHAEVTRGIVEVLAPLLSSLEVGERPQVMAVPEAYHLYTPIRGRLARPVSVLDLAGLLHPTPAVSGMPRPQAARWLAIQEPDRGWYSGGVGWLDHRGDGEFAVAIRAALVDRESFTCWAGAGIVAGSEPDSEFDETETKMRAAMDGLASDET